jgi:hypothetical protein
MADQLEKQIQSQIQTLNTRVYRDFIQAITCLSVCSLEYNHSSPSLLIPLN